MSASTNSEIGRALEDLNALVLLRDTEGWKLLCAKFDAELQKLTDLQDDLKTDALEAENLRQARGRIKTDFSPKTILAGMIKNREAVAARKLSPQATIPTSP